jgi:trigger factor
MSSENLVVECTEISPVVRSVSIEIEAKRVDAAFETAYKGLAKTAQVKGFRPGKTPRSVLERMYGASMPEEIERTLVSETLSDAMEKVEVSPISEPEIDAERPEAGKVFRYTVRVEVKPEITLPDLTTLTGSIPAILVDPGDVDKELESLRDRHASMVEEAEDAEAANGHTVSLDFVGRVGGEAFEGGTGQGMEVELGGGQMIPGFEEQLLGVKAGDDRQLAVTFPEDYGNAELAGQDATFDCHVVTIKRREVPELDDEFAKDVGEFDDLAALRASVTDDIEKRRAEQAEQTRNESLMTALIEASDFEVPPGIIERQLMNQMRQMHSQFQGKVPDDILHEQMSRMQEEGRENAERSVRQMLLIEAIGEAASIEVGEAEIDARLEEMAGAQGMEVAQLREMAQQQGWLDSIEAELTEKAAYAHLAEHATIEISEVEAAADEAEGEA